MSWHDWLLIGALGGTALALILERVATRGTRVRYQGDGRAPDYRPGPGLLQRPDRYQREAEDRALGRHW